jgi:hypothetical protein
MSGATALVGRGCQGFCDNSTSALVMKSLTMGGGGVKNPNLRDVIYGSLIRTTSSTKYKTLF